MDLHTGLVLTRRMRRMIFGGGSISVYRSCPRGFGQPSSSGMQERSGRERRSNVRKGQDAATLQRSNQAVLRAKDQVAAESARNGRN